MQLLTNYILFYTLIDIFTLNHNLIIFYP